MKKKIKKNVEVNKPLDETEEMKTVENEIRKEANDIEEDEGIDEFDDEEKALVENEPANDEETTTNTNTTTENTTTTLINDSDPIMNQWKEERWHQEFNDDTTSKRSSDTSIISHQSGSGSATKAVTICQDEIIVEINSQLESNENSDIDNVDLIQDDDDDDDEDEDEEANSEQKLLKSCKNNDIINIKAQVEVKAMHNGVGVNGFDEICMKIKMGW